MYKELYHHGIKGQRWHVRRYQNKDGTLTKAGKQRAYRRSQSVYKTLNATEKKHASYTDDPNTFRDKKSYNQELVTSLSKRDKFKTASVLNMFDAGDALDMQVMTRSDKRGKGYASHLVDAGIEWAKQSKYKEVLWEVSVDNSASIKLAEKKGFEFTRNLITNWDGTPSTLLYTKHLQ